MDGRDNVGKHSLWKQDNNDMLAYYVSEIYLFSNKKTNIGQGSSHLSCSLLEINSSSFFGYQVRCKSYGA